LTEGLEDDDRGRNRQRHLRPRREARLLDARGSPMIPERLVADWFAERVAQGNAPSCKALVVLLALARAIGPDGRTFTTAVALSEDTGLARRTVHRHLAELERMGAIVDVGPYLGPDGDRRADRAPRLRELGADVKAARRRS